MSALATTNQQSNVVSVTDSGALMNAIANAARDPNVDIDKMERLMVMHRDMTKQQAEASFNQAMMRVQSKMGRINTDKTNSQTHSKYATYGKLDRVLRPEYTAEGFALSFSTEPVEAEWVRVVCHVTHKDGHSRKYQIDMPADGKGAKGNDVMTKTHATGSATQYGMRYLLKMIFNVAISDDPEDDDGNGATGESHQGWLDAIDSCVDKAGLQGVKNEMFKKFGGALKVPRTLIVAYNEKLATCNV